MQTQIFAIFFAYTLISYTEAVEKCKDSTANEGYCRIRDKCPVAGALQESCSSGKICCPISETLRKRCQEYSKYVYTQESAAVLLPRMQLHNISKCHIEAVPLVVGGEKAHAMEFPHMVNFNLNALPRLVLRILRETYTKKGLCCLVGQKVLGLDKKFGETEVIVSIRNIFVGVNGSFLWYMIRIKNNVDYYNFTILAEACIISLRENFLVNCSNTCARETRQMYLKHAYHDDYLRFTLSKVAIGYGKRVETAEWMCGGSLISEKFVLTAAHCSKSREKGPAIFARLGDLDLRRIDDESHVQDFIIVERIIHPKYAPPSRYHDIALFRLSGSVDFSDFSRPACLHTFPNELSVTKAIATGWGKLDYRDVQSSSHLMKVTLDIINYEECNATFSAEVGGKIMHEGVIEHQLCAGDLGGGKDTCQGDSGGPLQIVLDNPYCMYEIIAVTSFGKFCGFKNSPAIYTKVSYYVDWIESMVWS